MAACAVYSLQFKLNQKTVEVKLSVCGNQQNLVITNMSKLANIFTRLQSVLVTKGGRGQKSDLLCKDSMI